MSFYTARCCSFPCMFSFWFLYPEICSTKVQTNWLDSTWVILCAFMHFLWCYIQSYFAIVSFIEFINLEDLHCLSLSFSQFRCGNFPVELNHKVKEALLQRRGPHKAKHKQSTYDRTLMIIKFLVQTNI